MNMLNLLKKISNRLNFIFYTHSSRYKLRYLYSYDRKRFIRHAGSLHQQIAEALKKKINQVALSERAGQQAEGCIGTPTPHTQEEGSHDN